MRILRNPTGLQPCVLVLGMFDGVHRGHQALLMAGVELAEQSGLPLNVCTFEPHPLQVLRPEMAPPLLTTLTERARIMADFGVDHLCILAFNHEVAAQTPEAFMASLVKDYQPRHVVCGFNYTFGRKGAGDAGLLSYLCREKNVLCRVMEPVCVDGRPVSSSRIRALIRDGNEAEAQALLGRSEDSKNLK
jgi:riboflavin kinase/FMN adenylyltransferase